MSQQELHIQERKKASSEGEHTKNEACFAPHVDIYETEQDVMVLADMPGVEPEGVDLSLEDNILTIRGSRQLHKPQGRVLFEEYESGHYLRRFTVSESIDQDRIEALLSDGVLRVRLPKAAPAQPRKISVQLG